MDGNCGSYTIDLTKTGGIATHIFMEKTMKKASEIIINPYEFYVKLKWLAQSLSNFVFQFSDDLNDGIDEEKCSLYPIPANQYQLNVVGDDDKILKTVIIPSEIIHNLVKDSRPNYNEFVEFYQNQLIEIANTKRIRQVISAIQTLGKLDTETLETLLLVHKTTPSKLHLAVASAFNKASK